MNELKLDHDAPDGMCVFAGCQFQAEKKAGWATSKGWVSVPACENHIRQCWDATIHGQPSRDTFTISPL